MCAGPGGFSEYMLWRKAFYNAKGFGFTLKGKFLLLFFMGDVQISYPLLCSSTFLTGKDDFKLGKFTASSAYYFEPYYGKHGDGDVMNPENINALEEFIMKGNSLSLSIVRFRVLLLFINSFICLSLISSLFVFSDVVIV